MKPNNDAVLLAVRAANKSLEYILEVLELRPGSTPTKEQDELLFTVLHSTMAHQVIITSLQFHTSPGTVLKTVARITKEWYTLYKEEVAKDDQKGHDNAQLP